MTHWMKRINHMNSTNKNGHGDVSVLKFQEKLTWRVQRYEIKQLWLKYIAKEIVEPDEVEREAEAMLYRS